MKYIKEFKLFESIDDNDKYLLNLSSANNIINAETWIAGTSPRITDRVKADAERSWSLYAVLNKITPPSRLKGLSNKELTDEIRVRGIRPMGLLPKATYFKLKKEVDAQLQGMYFRAKKERRPFGEVLNTYLNAQDITPEQKMEILNLWRMRLPVLNLPNF